MWLLGFFQRKYLVKIYEFVRIYVNYLSVIDEIDNNIIIQKEDGIVNVELLFWILI